MSFAGESHYALIAVMGAWIAIVFVLAARWTRATRRAILGALVGSLAAGATNMATDAGAFYAGFWRYTEVTSPFGPVLYYLEAGLGCGALALIVHRLRGWRARLAFLAVLAIWGPIRDCATAEATHLIAFHYEPAIVVVIADALSSFIIPVLVAYGATAFTDRRTRARPPRPGSDDPRRPAA